MKDDRIDKTIATITNFDEVKRDAEYWRQRPVEERLRALEAIRREHHGDAVDARIERVCRIIPLE